MMTTRYPLQWPPTWPRTKNPERSRFGGGLQKNDKPSVDKGFYELNAELERLGAKQITISTNVELKNNGEPHSGRKTPEDCGVAVYFKLDGSDQCIPCDKWDTVGCNLLAIAKTIDALRGLERWGAKEMVNAAFRGFQALPSPDMVLSMPSRRSWHDVLGVSPDAPDSVVKAAYRVLAKRAHPDMGGSKESWEELQQAYKERGAE